MVIPAANPRCNKNKEAVNQYNNALRQQWMLERNYQQGKFLLTENSDTILFGKPYNFEKRIEQRTIKQ